MGVSTVAIGLLPTYATIGVAAPLLLALCRFGQGLGLGGEWGGAVLLAIENAPPGKRAWYGMFPQLGAPLGFFFSGSVFLLLSRTADRRAVLQFGWRIPVPRQRGAGGRRPLRAADDHRNAGLSATRCTVANAVKVPMLAVFRDHFKTLVVGVLASLATFVLFYLMTVFALSWGTTALGYRRETFLLLQLVGIVCFALTIPLSAVLAERGRGTLLGVSIAIAVFGLVMAPLLTAGNGRRRPDDGDRAVADGTDLRAARHGAVGALSHRRALHRQLADVQPGRHLRRLARALCGDVAGDDLRAAVRRVLPDRRPRC